MHLDPHIPFYLIAPRSPPGHERSGCFALFVGIALVAELLAPCVCVGWCAPAPLPASTTDDEQFSSRLLLKGTVPFAAGWPLLFPLLCPCSGNIPCVNVQSVLIVIDSVVFQDAEIRKKVTNWSPEWFQNVSLERSWNLICIFQERFWRLCGPCAQPEWIRKLKWSKSVAIMATLWSHFLPLHEFIRTIAGSLGSHHTHPVESLFEKVLSLPCAKAEPSLCMSLKSGA